MFIKMMGCDIQITLGYSKPGLARNIETSFGKIEMGSREWEEK